MVGDVARYWYFLNNRNGSLILADHQDAPGVHIQDGMRLMPFVTGEVNDHAPNNGATAGPTEPGTAVPDAFVRKDPANPMNVTPGLTYPTQCFAPTVRGWIPTSTVLHRASGIYVAFTRPGKHRITLRDNDLTVSPEIIHTLTAEEGRAAQDANSYLPPYGTLQTLFFEREVADVFVWIAGRVVNSPALGNPVPTVKLVQTQRAVVNVEPTEGRQYTVMLTSPDTGGVLRAESDLVFVAQTQNASESIDIARVHRCNDDGVYSSEDLSKHGVHLPEDLYITVRQVEIEVVDTLTVREAIPSMGDLLGDLALDVGENNELRPGGEVRYILVPASGAAPVRLGDLDYGLAPAQMPTPVPTNPAPTSIPKQVPDNLKPFLGSDGAIFEITLAADDPPEEEVEATLEIDVGPTNNRGTLVAKVTLVPHCRLVLPGGGVNYQITPVVGVDTVVVLRCEDDGGAAVNVRLVSVTPAGVADVTVETDDTENVTITIGENAPKDFYQILVEDIANPDHMARRTFEVI
ncbi:MAG: hypothetical protein AB8I69_03935 [Anaerolineae bacterium]